MTDNSKQRCKRCEGLVTPHCTPQRAPAADWYDNGTDLVPTAIYSDCPLQEKKMTERKAYDKKIELCQPCEGKGYIQRDELTDYHRREYDLIRSTCAYCEGNGRVMADKTIIYRPLTELEKTTEGRF